MVKELRPAIVVHVATHFLRTAAIFHQNDELGVVKDGFDGGNSGVHRVLFHVALHVRHLRRLLQEGEEDLHGLLRLLQLQKEKKEE